MLTIKNSARFAELWAIAILGVVILLTGCTPPGPRALLDGERLIREGKYGPAVEKLKLATQLLPENAQAWNHLGLANYGSGKINDAIKAYQQAISRNPNLPSPRYNLGCLYLEQGYPREAIDPLTVYTVLQPGVFEGWVRLGTAQLRAQQLDVAEKSLQRALQMRPNSAEVLNSLGVIASHRRRTRDAIQFFQAAIKQNPDYPPALLNSAILCQHALAQPALALERYSAYLRTAPSGEHAAVVRETVRYLELALRPPPRMAVATNPPPTAAPSTASVATVQAPVVTNIVKPPVSTAPPPVTTVAPTNPPVVVASPSPASTPATNIQKVVQAPTPVPQPQTNAVAHQPKQAPATPSSTQEEPVIPPPKAEIVKLDDDPLPQVAKDVSGSTTPPASNAAAPGPGTPDPATPASAAQSAEAQSPLVSKIQAPSDRGGIMDRLNPIRWFRSKDEPDTAPEPSPATPPPAREPLPNIRTVAKAQNAGATDSYLMPLPTPAPMKRYGYRSLAKPPAGDQAKAQQSLAQGVEAHKDRRLTEAVEMYREAVQADPSSFEAHYNLGLALFEMRDLEPSLSAYETALSINPTSLNARFNFALALQRGNYFQDAAGELEKVLADHGNEVRAHFTLGNLYAQQLYNLDRARFHYRKVLELDPNHPQAIAIRHWIASNP